jgi:hypothetical protein
LNDFTLEQFRKAMLAGAFVRIFVVSDWTHFSIRAEMRNKELATLTTTRTGRERRFLNPAATLVLLRQMGVKKVEVEMEKWDLEMASLSMRMRPDVTARRLRDNRVAVSNMLTSGSYELGDLGAADRREEILKIVEKKMRERD